MRVQAHEAKNISLVVCFRVLKTHRVDLLYVVMCDKACFLFGQAGSNVQRRFFGCAVKFTGVKLVLVSWVGLKVENCYCYAYY